jgi:RimJ/RimL family protein N-acetyltransferase
MIKPIFIDLPEYIETPRLLLTHSKAGMGHGLHKAILDGYEDLIKWLNWPLVTPTKEATEEECRTLHAKFILREDIRYVIIEKHSQTIIGRCAYAPPQTNWMIPKFGISYFISKSFRNKGYGSEATNILTRLAFQQLKARRVEIKVDPDNIASLKIPEKLNYTLESKEKGTWFRSDKDELSYIWTYAIFGLDNLPPIKTN